MNTSRNQLTACSICGERLEDPKSVSRGIGPVCAGKLAKFVAAVGSSLEELAAFAVMADGAALRYLRCAMRALGAGRIAHAKLFYALARDAGEAARREDAKDAAKECNDLGAIVGEASSGELINAEDHSPLPGCDDLPRFSHPAF